MTARAAGIQSRVGGKPIRIPHALLPIMPKLLSMPLPLPPMECPLTVVRRWMKGDEAVLVPAAAFMNKSEIWLEEGETAAVDHAAVDEWVGVLRPDDQVSITLLGKKWGVLSASVESSVRSSISSSASIICVSAVEASVGTLLVVVTVVVVVVVAVMVVCDFFVGDLYEAVDTFSTNTGSCELSLSSSSLSSSSEHTVLCGTLFVPPLNKPRLVFALLRLLTGPAVVES